ncbi:MAG: STAS domain-containing protein [Alteromonadaceae bacterium]|nr:STAS domain-containing protein [Alteromonadaceae bacterium]
MVYQQTKHLHYQILKLTGEVDLHNSPQVRKQLLAILKNGSSVLVDFSSLSYIDSSGIATLVEAFNLAKNSKLLLTIVGAVGAPLQVLELTNLNKVFHMVDSLDDIKG